MQDGRTHSKPIVYVDLDGVCVDLFGAYYRAFGKPEPRDWTNWLEDFPSDWDYVYELIFENAPTFFRDLREYEWLDVLWETLSNVAEPVILTAGGRPVQCFSDKVVWIRRKFGTNFKDYIITSRKSDLASPGRFLIDDLPQHVKDFSDAGGTGFLFPQPWNQKSPDQQAFIERLPEMILSQMTGRET